MINASRVLLEVLFSTKAHLEGCFFLSSGDNVLLITTSLADVHYMGWYSVFVLNLKLRHILRKVLCCKHVLSDLQDQPCLHKALKGPRSSEMSPLHKLCPDVQPCIENL